MLLPALQGSRGVSSRLTDLVVVGREPDCTRLADSAEPGLVAGSDCEMRSWCGLRLDSDTDVGGRSRDDFFGMKEAKLAFLRGLPTEGCAGALMTRAGEISD